MRLKKQKSIFTGLRITLDDFKAGGQKSISQIPTRVFKKP